MSTHTIRGIYLNPYENNVKFDLMNKKTLLIKLLVLSGFHKIQKHSFVFSLKKFNQQILKSVKHFQQRSTLRTIVAEAKL